VKATWAALRAAAAPVLADLERSHPGCVRLERHDAVDEPEAVLWDADPDGAGTGLSLSDGHEEPWQAVLDMTDQVQEAVFEYLWQTWPECPDHANGHPLTPDGDAGRAVWRCPTSGRAIAEVGSLGR
jgi:hypothetical protein